MGGELLHRPFVLIQRQRQCRALDRRVNTRTDTGKPTHQRMRQAFPGVDVHDQTLDPTTDNNPCKTRGSSHAGENSS
ncbi:hypothetical protein [Actinopolymorpha pittospori]|uniref:Uncharacterized protein n=1 Tax=Actinopolymorpha pittospori TaxID=648752 RepID=A0A927RKV0_9ACTN|nr:hypothetical protein [Actinopolymorpha pittospori]MBE1607128.1 hypothetical protein [Actinopolymorpha pittospori]